MSLNLEDYSELLNPLSPQVREILQATFHEAARVMSPAGLQHYLEGAKGLSHLGRGTDLVATYLQEMPVVAREVGEDAVQASVVAALKLSSMTSGEILALYFATLPTAARRLGDYTLFQGYLTFLHQLAALAPRGLRPLFGALDELLTKLTLGGLRRWAFFGAEAHRTDYTTQAAYFSLRTADSQAMIQQEHKGVLFVDNHRRLSAYLRVLWGRDFWLRPAAAERSEFKPYIEGFVLHLPDAVEDTGPLKGLESYRAIAAHMAAHVVYTPQPLSAQALNPAQMALIGLMEDARVEFCAMTDLPGLRHSWRTLLAAARPGAVEHPTIATLEQLALALLDDGHPTGDEQLDTLARTFHASVASRRLDPTLSWDLGMTLYHHLNTRKQLPSLRLLESLRIPYRDDNRHPWQTEVSDWERALEVVRGPRQVRRKVSLMEFINETDVETAGDDAQEVWVLDGVLYDDDGVTYNEKEGREPVSDPFHYPEWDYKVQLHRPDWTTVYERRSPKGDAAVIDEILHRHRPTTHRLRQIVERLRPQGVVRQRKLEDGDEIDLNAAVDALVNLRSGHSYDPRITMRYVIKRRDLAVVILLDLSESTNDPVRGAENTVLSLTREASALLAQAVQNIGDPFAIHGFCSDGRHDVKYYRLKDFDSHFEASVKSNLAGMTGGFSTRMGSALRHAGQHLLNQPQRRKLLLLVTDGAPADIDEREPAHLRHDAKKAVEELTTRGITPFCLTLDPRADPYAAHIFGPKGYTIVDRVERLPERLPMLFVKLTG